MRPLRCSSRDSPTTGVPAFAPSNAVWTTTHYSHRPTNLASPHIACDPASRFRRQAGLPAIRIVRLSNFPQSSNPAFRQTRRAQFLACQPLQNRATFGADLCSEEPGRRSFNEGRKSGWRPIRNEKSDPRSLLPNRRPGTVPTDGYAVMNTLRVAQVAFVCQRPISASKQLPRRTATCGNRGRPSRVRRTGNHA